MYFNDFNDYFDDYSEFDAQIDEFKESLMSGLKQEIKDELERLRKENKELKDVKRNFEKIKRDYELKAHELECEKEEYKRDFFKKTIKELFEENCETLYQVDYDYIEREKCNKCNDEKKHVFQTPDGITHEVSCSCSGREMVFVVSEQKMVRTTIRKNGYSRLETSIYFGFRNDEYLRLEDMNINERFNDEVKDLTFGVYYYTREEAQKHVDYLNNKE